VLQQKHWADYNRAIRMALAEKQIDSGANDEVGDVLNTVKRIAQTVTANLADAHIVQHLCTAIREGVAADFAYLIGFDPETRTCHTLGGDESEADKRGEVFDARHTRDDILASCPELSGGSCVEIDASATAAIAEHYRGIGFQRVLHVPLPRADELGGVLLVGRRTSSQAFSDPVREVIAGSISHAALALEIDRTRRQLARTEQLSRYLAANISHELRNTFSVIIGYGEILRDEARRAASLEGTNAAMVERLYTAACEGLELLRPAFELSNPMREQTPLEIEEVAVGALLDDLVAERFAHQRPEVGLNTDVDPELPALRTDRMKLRMILEQILSNAQKFTFTGEVAITAKTNDDGRIVIAIADTGPGISSERLAAAFDALADPKGEATRDPASGLGLYISKQLADKLGAIIDVESLLGQGTTVRITLPSRPPA
jgi:signal transduction histidine kinase